MDWEIPTGMCVLVGPNGSGKSTLLRAWEFLVNYALRGLNYAVQESGGLAGLRHFDAGDASIRFDVRSPFTTWSVEVPFSGSVPERLPREELEARGTLVASFAAAEFRGTFLGAPATRARGESMVVKYLDTREAQADVADGDGINLEARVYCPLRFDLASLRRNGSPVDSAVSLAEDGSSVWSVLRNWRDKRETRAQYDFVVSAMRDAFGATFEDLEFEFTAQLVSGRVIVPARKESVPFHLFSDGWLTGLLLLCAVASVRPGELLAIDEPENSLHPHAIRAMLRHMGEWVTARRASLILATHSPVVLNQFDDRSRVFVIEPDHATVPVPLDQHPNAEWLSHFAVGDAYANEEVGAPRVSP